MVIKTTEAEIIKHIIDIKESQARTETTVTAIDKAINGYDQNPGLIYRVTKLEGDKKYIYGFSAALTFIVGMLKAFIYFIKGWH